MFADVPVMRGWSWPDLAIAVVVVAAVVGLVTVALRKFGVGIPDWVVQVFWIVAVAFVVIGAIRIVAGL